MRGPTEVVAGKIPPPASQTHHSSSPRASVCSLSALCSLSLSHLLCPFAPCLFVISTPSLEIMAMASELSHEDVKGLFENITIWEQKIENYHQVILKLTDKNLKETIRTIVEENNRLEKEIIKLELKLNVIITNVKQNESLLKLKLNQQETKLNKFIESANSTGNEMKDQIKALRIEIEVLTKNKSDKPEIQKHTTSAKQKCKKTIKKKAANQDVLSSKEDILLSGEAADEDKSEDILASEEAVDQVSSEDILLSGEAVAEEKSEDILASGEAVDKDKSEDILASGEAVDKDKSEDILASGEAADQDGTENIFAAAFRGSLPGVKFHYARNPSVLNENAPDCPNGTPLSYASDRGNLQIVRFLVSKGAVVDGLSADTQLTPLMEAAINGHLDVVKFLLSKGANVNHQDKQLETPLHFAIMGNNLDVVKVLVENGADKSIKNAGLLTALELAKLNGNMPDIVSFLSSN